MTDRTSQYASVAMVQDIWMNFAKAQLDHIMAPVLLDNLVMDSSVVLDDFPSEAHHNEFLDAKDEAVELRSMDSRLAPTANSELTDVTAKTTQSTRDKLTAVLDENQELHDRLVAALQLVNPPPRCDRRCHSFRHNNSSDRPALEPA